MQAVTPFDIAKPPFLFLRLPLWQFILHNDRMCGIAGGLHLKQDQLGLMLDALQHRGPDGRGDFQAGPFCIGMTRLAILDQKNGDQPFSSSCQRVQAVCNGEIYNWRELRAELEEAGHRFHTRCDCEIIPAAWMEWGKNMLDRFDGMFALALHDQQTGSLFLARDRCGQKPLYLTTSGPLYFASEIKALKAAAVELSPDPRYLAQWLSLRYVSEPATLFKDIETLPAAHWMTISPDGIQQLERYWEPPSRPGFQSSSQTDNKPPESLEKTIDQLDELSRHSVELSLQSDVPLATYLSAGVDSSLLAHYIKDLGADLTSVSIGFGSDSDETAAAASFASQQGLEHHPVQLGPEALNDLPRVIHQMDRPVGDALILAFDKLASHTSKLGCKVALGGEGPDEHFAGYSFHQSYLRAAGIGNLGRALASSFVTSSPLGLLNKISQFPASLGPEGRAKTASYLRHFDSLTASQQAYSLRTLFEEAQINHLLHPDIRAQQACADDKLNYPAKHDRLDFALRLQYPSWLPDWSLIRQDKNTMAHSVEYRAPFLDHHIIDFAFSLPDHYKIRHSQNKFIWRQLAERHLPRKVTRRPKQPFYLPLESPVWREPLLKMAHDVLAPSGFTCHGWLNPEAVRPLLSATHFLPLKQLAAVLILQLWLDSIA